MLLCSHNVGGVSPLPDRFCALKGSHHTRQPRWHSHDNLMGDNNWAWLEYCGLRNFRGQPQLYCKRKAHSVYVLQLYLRVYSSLHNQKVGGNQLIKFLDRCLPFFLTYMETPILIFVAVWHKVLLCCWNWTNGEEILVHDPSKKRPRCSIYIWSYRYIPIFRGYSLIDLFTKQSVHISSSLLSALNSSISEWLMSLNLLQIYAGDLGQSFDSNVTLAHYESNSKAQAVLFAGDLSYADNYPYHDNVRWDTWARFVERNVAYQPWIWTAGNHEIDFAPELVSSSLFTGLILD